MFAGVEIPSLFSQGPATSSDRASSASSYQNIQGFSNKAGQANDHLSDQIDLSEEARNFLREGRQALQELRKGPEKLRQQDEEFISKRLEQLQEQIGFLKSLLSQAQPEQANPLINGLKQVGTALHALGRQIGAITPQPQTLQIEQRQVEVTAISLSASFNSVATIQNEDGSVTQIEQSLEIQFDYLHVSVSEQSLTLQGAGALPENISDQFQQTVKGFNELASELQALFTDKERFPPGLYQVIRDILTAALEPGQEHVVNQAA
ncbi:MAG: hypothetical protein H6868_07195 [Rhodospirillales bacterium]|nr:hypothetical protein [Rhodospirillales bacterium]